MRVISRLSKATSGAAAIEYGLLAALIGLTLVVSLQTIGVNIAGVFEDIDSSMDVAD